MHPFYEETTTFPVNAAETLIKKTTKNNSTTKVFVDKHMSSKQSRTELTEIINCFRTKLSLDLKVSA